MDTQDLATPKTDLDPDALVDLPVENWQTGNSSADCVYFVQSGKDGPIKVGRSTYGTLRDRVCTLQIGNPEKLIVRRVLWDGERNLESRLHAALSEDWIRGEWFKPTPTVLDFATPRQSPVKARNRPVEPRWFRSDKERDRFILDCLEAGEDYGAIAHRIGETREKATRLIVKVWRAQTS